MGCEFCPDGYRYAVLRFDNISVGDVVGLKSIYIDCDIVPPGTNPWAYIFTYTSTTNDSNVFANDFAIALKHFLNNNSIPNYLCREENKLFILLDWNYSGWNPFKNPNIWACIEGQGKVSYVEGQAWQNCVVLGKTCLPGGAYWRFKFESIDPEATISVNEICSTHGFGYRFNTNDVEIAAERFAKAESGFWSVDRWYYVKHLGNGLVELIISPQIVLDLLFVEPNFFDKDLQVCTYNVYDNPGYSGPPLAEISYPLGNKILPCPSECCFNYHEVLRVFPL